jgi:UDP-N-acetylmuramate dehydrogenase
MLSQGGLFLHRLVSDDLAAHLEAWHRAGKVQLDEPLAGHTTIGVGGKASAYFVPENQHEFITAIRLCHRFHYPYFVLGAGSKLLFSDQGYLGLVISTQRLQKVAFEDHRIRVSAGTPLTTFLDIANAVGIRCFNFLAGIPGTLGGAIAMNAGIPERSIADVLEKVGILSEEADQIVTLDQKECRFAYRQSAILQERFPVLWAYLRTDGKPYERTEMLARRRASQPLDSRSAGCVFKNPPEFSAGYLIEKAGLKGLTVGMAKVSEKHANFIVNTGGATASEIRKLIDIVRQKVYKSFRISLELEIEILGG